MKRLLFLLIAGLASLSSRGLDITGTWSGALEVQGAQMQVVFHIRKEASGYSATVDSPEQGAKGITATSITYENSTLKLSLADAGIEYEGTLSADGSITGTFRQLENAFPLTISRSVVENELLSRPQEPTKPYPYREEEVRFENSEDTVTLVGTLTLPQKKGNFPAVVLVSASGAQNRDEEIMGHRPFLVLADYLTRNGIAVLRFDDRGAGASSGNFREATTYDFSQDAEAAIDYLQTRREIDREKIGLVGHSEGGCAASMVAARDSDVAFVVLLASIGIRGDQLISLQQRLISEASGISDKSKVINRGLLDVMQHSSSDMEQLKNDLTAFLEQATQDIQEEEEEEEDDDDDDDDDLFIKDFVDELVTPWLQYFISYDPATTLEKVKCPVLAINGEKDVQVPAKPNLEAIEAALTRGGNRHITVKEMSGLNHLFQECATGLPAEYPAIEQTFSPVAMSEILAWIKARTE